MNGMIVMRTLAKVVHDVASSHNESASVIEYVPARIVQFKFANFVCEVTNDSIEDTASVELFFRYHDRSEARDVILTEWIPNQKTLLEKIFKEKLEEHYLSVADMDYELE